MLGGGLDEAGSLQVEWDLKEELGGFWVAQSM